MVTTKELNYELRVQKSNLKILITSFEKINATLEQIKDFSGLSRLYSFLERLQDAITSTQETIKFIKDYISKSVKPDANKTELKEMSKMYTELIRSSTHLFNQFILEYINSSTYDLEEVKYAQEEVVDTATEQEKEPVTEQINADIETAKDIVNNGIAQAAIIEEENEKQEKDNPYCEYEDNVLLISEKQCKFVLPYSIKELNSILNIDNSYATIQDIIEERYTIPISFYKNPFVSRFKETYNLMKYKEQAPLTRCLKVAIEVSKIRNLNPAIITACNNYEQLNQFLNYLQKNETDKFEGFNIKYEASPAL